MFDTLNAEQERAVRFEGRNLLIVAGAGTGKTTTLAARLAHLVATGTPAERILLLTFSRRAAGELLSRAEAGAGRGVAAAVWGGTFHAVANRLLRRYGGALGLDPSFTVMDQGDAAELMGIVRDDLVAGDGTARRRARKETLVEIMSRCINAREPLAEVLQHQFPWCQDERDDMKTIFAGYTARKRARQMLDYDDLLLCWWGLLRQPEVAKTLGGLFDHILVDEYQDTNALQADILDGMVSGGARLTVVGDDAQSIYSFRAATHANIMGFGERFDAELLTLVRNHRSTPPLIATTNAVIAHARNRHPKDLIAVRTGTNKPVLVRCHDEAMQAVAVTERILSHKERGTPLRQQAVLVRSGHHSDLLELELTARHIPFVKYGGLKFLEAAHVKDLVSLLRLAENPLDELAWTRLLLLQNGIGRATARRLTSELLATSGSSPTGDEARPDNPVASVDDDASVSAKRSFIVYEPDQSYSGETGRRIACVPTHPYDVVAQHPACGDLAQALREIASLPEDDVVPKLERARAFLEPLVAHRYDNWEARVADYEQLQIAASLAPTLSRFLVELTLDPPAATGDLAGPPSLDDDVLTLSTIHSAKGGEWDVVHVMHVADGNIPSDMATGNAESIEEERRLLYVALTRARDDLYAYVPLRYHHQHRGKKDKHGYAQVSRFLTPSVLATMDNELAGPALSPDQPVIQRTKGLERLAALDNLMAELF